MQEGAGTEIERREAPRSAEELRALLDLDVPLVLTGMGKGLPAMGWTVEHLVAMCGEVKFPVIRTDAARHLPGAGDTMELTLAELLALLARQEPGVRHYLAGPNLFAHEERLRALLAECEAFHRTAVVRGRIGALGMWLGKTGQRTWLHFDCANNFLLQIRGRKTFMLAPPEAYPNLYCYTFSSCNGQDMEGEMYRFSEVNAWGPDLQRHPRAARVAFRCATLEAGEALLLPLGWFHAVETQGEPDYNVALNLFFDAEPQDWGKRKYLKAFRQKYA